MQELVKLPEISRVMQDLSREMMRAGIIEEMLEDTMEDLEPEELEEEAQKEVDKVCLYSSTLFLLPVEYMPPPIYNFLASL